MPGRARLTSRRPASRPASHRETGTLRQATRIRPDTGPTDRRRILAAVLSALIPGLGQAYNRRSRLALALFIPFAVVGAIALLAIWAVPAPRLVAIAIVPRNLDLLLGFNLVLLAWRLVALVQAFFDTRFELRPGGLGLVGLAVVVLATIAPHVGAQYVGGLARSTFAEVFDGNVLGARSDAATDRVPGENERLNVLLVGIDAAADRDHALTDSLIVVSLDPVGRSVSMASLPRDLVNVPLGDGRTFAPKLNSLLSYAIAHPKDFPAGGMRTLENAVGTLLGIPIHYYATVDLAGFAKMVDAVGGVDVNVKTRPSTIDEVPRLRDHRPEGRHVRGRAAAFRRHARPRLRPDPPVGGPDATSPARPASRRSSWRSARRSSRATRCSTCRACSRRSARRSRPTCRPSDCPTWPCWPARSRPSGSSGSSSSSRWSTRPSPARASTARSSCRISIGSRAMAEALFSAPGTPRGAGPRRTRLRRLRCSAQHQAQAV